LPDSPVTFQKEENEWVTVECGKSTFRLPGIAMETFPELPKFNATPFAINASLLTTIIQQTIFAITTEESRYTLFGAKSRPTATAR
jgi:DNA polymerase III subunit beta